MKLDAWINGKIPAPAEPRWRLGVPPWTLLFGAPHHFPFHIEELFISNSEGKMGAKKVPQMS